MNLKEIRILHITNNLGIGGVQKILYEICDSTKNEFAKIVVASSGGEYAKRLSKLGITHIDIPDLSTFNPSSMQKIYRSLKQIVEKYEINIIHCHHRMAVPYARALVGKKYVIYNNHTIYSDKRIFSNLILSGVNIIADGEKAKQNVVDFFGIKNNIVVINNAVDAFDENINEIPLISEQRKAGKFIVMNSARLHPQKGLNYFIEAAEILKREHCDIAFFIVGDGPLRDNLTKQVLEKNLQDDVFFLGFRNDIKSTISQCDVLVLTSIYEGLPLTPMEAFSVHKAVIGTNIDGTKEVIKSGYNGLLAESKNPVDIAEKIYHLYDDKSLLSQLCSNAYESYLREFSLHHFKTSYLEYYSHIGK